jgi:hypothetical protein
MIALSQLALKTHTNLGFAATFATLDKLVDKFTLPPAALPIGDASLTHVINLAAHSTTSPTPTALRQSFIMTPYIIFKKCTPMLFPCFKAYFLEEIDKGRIVSHLENGSCRISFY